MFLFFSLPDFSGGKSGQSSGVRARKRADSKRPRCRKKRREKIDPVENLLLRRRHRRRSGAFFDAARSSLTKHARSASERLSARRTEAHIESDRERTKTHLTSLVRQGLSKSRERQRAKRCEKEFTRHSLCLWLSLHRKRAGERESRFSLVLLLFASLLFSFLLLSSPLSLDDSMGEDLRQLARRRVLVRRERRKRKCFFLDGVAMAFLFLDSSNLSSPPQPPLRRSAASFFSPLARSHSHCHP